MDPLDAQAAGTLSSLLTVWYEPPSVVLSTFSPGVVQSSPEDVQVPACRSPSISKPPGSGHGAAAAWTGTAAPANIVSAATATAASRRTPMFRPREVVDIWI